MTATNSIGTSDVSAASAGVVPVDVPGSPFGVQATRGNGKITLSFVPSLLVSGSPTIDFTATCSPGGQSTTGAASPLDVTGLTNGVLHACSVTARNAVGSSPPSVPAIAVPGEQKPASACTTARAS